MQLDWLLRLNLVILYLSLVPLSLRTTISLASTFSTTPEFLATTTTPESLAVLCSIPVPTTGASVDKSGTA